MSNFMETYGKAIFTLVIIAILITFASTQLYNRNDHC